jgi:hypothetical protein
MQVWQCQNLPRLLFVCEEFPIPDGGDQSCKFIRCVFLSRHAVFDGAKETDVYGATIIRLLYDCGCS